MTDAIGPATDVRRAPSPAAVDPSVPHVARIYDYLLGGQANFEVDREAARRAADAYGGIDRARADARANRDFLGRVVRWLALEAGVKQFLDLGTGIPGGDNVHAVARGVAPESRIVYVDHDPIVVAHAHQLLHGVERTTFLPLDLRDPRAILGQAADTLDFSEPVGVLCVAILHVLTDDEDPYGVVGTLMDAVASGSYLAVSHLASDVEAQGVGEGVRRANERLAGNYVARSRREVTRFFDGLALVEPGVVQVDRWRAEPEPGAAERIFWGAVARKP
jgi:hypothetical protein